MFVVKKNRGTSGIPHHGMSHIPHVNTLPQSGINTFLQTVSHKSCPLPSLLNNFQQRIISLLPTMKWSRITQTWQLLHGMLRVSTALKSCLFIYQHSFRSNIYQCKNHTNSCTSSKTLFLKTKIGSNLHTYLKSWSLLVLSLQKH